MNAKRIDIIAGTIWNTMNARSPRVKTADGKRPKWETLAEQGRADEKAWMQTLGKAVSKALDDWRHIDEYEGGMVLLCRAGEDWVRLGYQYSEHGAIGWLSERHDELPGTPTHFQLAPRAKDA